MLWSNEVKDWMHGDEEMGYKEESDICNIWCLSGMMFHWYVKEYFFWGGGAFNRLHQSVKYFLPFSVHVVLIENLIGLGVLCPKLNKGILLRIFTKLLIELLMLSLSLLNDLSITELSLSKRCPRWNIRKTKQMCSSENVILIGKLEHSFMIPFR